MYALTPSGVAQHAGLTSRFLKRKMEEYEALKLEIEQLKQESLAEQAMKNLQEVVSQ